MPEVTNDAKAKAIIADMRKSGMPGTHAVYLIHGAMWAMDQPGFKAMFGTQGVEHLQDFFDKTYAQITGEDAIVYCPSSDYAANIVFDMGCRS